MPNLYYAVCRYLHLNASAKYMNKTKKPLRKIGKGFFFFRVYTATANFKNLS
jgi:hypothetical protein